MTMQRRRKSGTTAVGWLLVVILPLMMVGCQLGIGARGAPTPVPPATPLPPETPLPPVAQFTPVESLTPSAPLPPPTPTLGQRKSPVGPVTQNNTKIIDGKLHVWYIPCPPAPPATWMAAMVLSDLRSGSFVYLNRDGTAKARPEPVYLTAEGQARLEAALEDSSVLEQIVLRPECPSGLK